MSALDIIERAGGGKRMADLKGRDLLTLHDYSPKDISAIIDLADKLKAELAERGSHMRRTLEGKSVVLYFEKQSLRTRVSFEIGVAQLGGQPVVIYSGNTHADRGEPRQDTARVLSRYAHGIVIRAYKHEDIVQTAEWADIPVINALCERAHPCQALADLMTIYEKRGRGKKTKVAYIGDANNIAASLMILLSKVGIDIALACPDGYKPEPALIAKVEGYAEAEGGSVEVVDRPVDAVKDADFVYTDVWVSMGMEEEERERREAFEGYCINNKLMKAAKSDALFMHDLPAHRGEEVSDNVIEGPRSIVFDQAENRLHAQKALLSLLIGD